MTVSYPDISSSLQRRAQKVTTARGLYILNELVQEDIYHPTVKTFKDFFEESVTIVMVDGTTVYALPSDFQSSRRVFDDGDNLLLRGDNTPLDVEPKNKVKIFGGNLTVDPDRSFDEVLVEYYKPIPDFDATSNIVLPDDISAALKNIWVTGLEFYYFTDNKKTQEAQIAFTRYKDAKNRKFTYSIGSLVSDERPRRVRRNQS